MICTIVGRGPSLLTLSAEDVADGPVIALNAAIERVRTWGLDAPLYSLQKDGCITEPLDGETVILSEQLSAHCWPDARRMILDLDVYGLKVNAMSVVLAVAFAYSMGATEVRMLAFDSLTHNDNRLVVGDKIQKAGRDYRPAARRAQAYAESVGLAIEWV